MANSVGGDILEGFDCPVCFEIPVAEVFECDNGHWLCRRCYFQITPPLCPECRTRLDRDRPKRSRAIERVLEGIKVDCVFKSNGCDKKLSRGSAQGHQTECIFKLGRLVNLCKRIGYPNCDFKFNNGTAKQAVEHFVSKHGCILTTSEQFQMELISFKESAEAGGSGFHFWTPIIADLKERKCYILTMVVLNKVDASFAWFSIFLPYPTNEHPQSSLVEIDYTVKTGGDLKFTFWTVRPMSLKEANELFPDSIDFVNYSLSLIRRCSIEGSLFIDCNIKQREFAIPRRRVNVQSFVCTRNTDPVSISSNIQPPNFEFDLNPRVPVRFNRNGGSYAVKNFLSKLNNDCKSNRNNLWLSLRNLFDGGNWAGLTGEDVEWLKMELLFVTAEYGNMEALRYLIGKGVNFNVVDELHGKGPLHYTMLDKNKKIGMEKAKLLVESETCGVDVLDDRKWSALHYAAMFGSNEAVEYFFRKGCNVNDINNNGWTPLHYAVSNSNDQEGLKIAKSLLASGANPSIQNKFGENPFDFATKKGKTNIAQLLHSQQSSR